MVLPAALECRTGCDRPRSIPLWHPGGSEQDLEFEASHRIVSREHALSGACSLDVHRRTAQWRCIHRQDIVEDRHGEIRLCGGVKPSFPQTPETSGLDVDPDVSARITERPGEGSNRYFDFFIRDTEHVALELDRDDLYQRAHGVKPGASTSMTKTLQPGGREQRRSPKR